jgi:hypothetical protein
MGNWLEKFLSFDRMMGEDLVRKTYYLGLLLIAGWAVLSLLGALFFIFSNFSRSISLIVTTPLIALFALMIWRVIAERLMLDWQGVDDEPEAGDEAPIPGEVVGAGAAAEPQEEVVDVEFAVATEEEVEVTETVVVEEDPDEEIAPEELAGIADEDDDLAEEESETRP